MTPDGQMAMLRASDSAKSVPRSRKCRRPADGSNGAEQPSARISLLGTSEGVHVKLQESQQSPDIFRLFQEIVYKVIETPERL